jgi:hypothetical protein
MLGSRKSRGYYFEMICADFLAGASLEPPNSRTLFDSVRRLPGLLSLSQKSELAKDLTRIDERSPVEKSSDQTQ